MKRISVELTDEAHINLLELQLERKKKRIEPTAINKIASELLEAALKNKKPAR